jgi:hypothetical protein
MRRLAWVVCGLALLVVGCERKVIYEIHVSGDNWLEPSAQEDPFALADVYRLTVDGQPQGPFKIERLAGPRITLKAKDPSQNLPRVEAEVHTLCGWQSVPAKVEIWTSDQTSGFGFEIHRSVQINLAWRGGSADAIGVFVDNRASRTDATIGVGERKAVIKAGEAGYATLPIWPGASCDAAKHLQLDGKNLIPLPKKGGTLLVDTTASHCYAYRSVLYGDQRYSTRYEYRESEFWTRAKIRMVKGGIHYFLKEPPDKITTRNPFERADIRYSVSDSPC